MKKTKVISVRIDEQLLTQIDEKVSHLRYSTRNDLICGLLRFASQVDETKQLDRLCSFYPEFGDIIDEFEFTYHREYK